MGNKLEYIAQFLFITGHQAKMRKANFQCFTNLSYGIESGLGLLPKKFGKICIFKKADSSWQIHNRIWPQAVEDRPHTCLLDNQQLDKSLSSDLMI